MGNGAYGQCGHRGQWGTGDMGNEAHRGKVVQGVWGAEVWGIWAMRPTGGMGYRGMGHMVNRSHGQWGTWAMGPCDGLRWFKLCVKMSSCQKDVKCQIVKHLDYGGGSQKK